MRWFVITGLLLVIPSILPVDPRQAAAESTATPTAPPVAARRPVRLTAHGIERVDDYGWLRDPNWREVIQDPSRLAPEIRAHLDAENNYSDAMLAPLAGLRAKLIEEMKGRIEQFDSGVPMLDGPYAYWSRYMPGAEQPQLVRAPRNGGAEQILLDGAALAAGKAYFSFGTHRHSPDHRLYGYLVDETGSEAFTLRVLDIGAGRDLPDVITDVTDFTWLDDTTLIYVRLDDEYRGRFAYRHRVGSDPASDQLVFEEKDHGFSVEVNRTSTGRFVVLTTDSSDTSEAWLFDTARPENPPRLVVAREPKLEYHVDDWGDVLVIRTNADGAEDFKIVTAPLSTPGRANWRDFVPAKEGRQVLSFAAFAGHLVTLERDDGLERLVIYRKADGTAHAVAFGDEAYALELTSAFEFNTTTVRFEYSSPATPLQTFDYDMESRERVLRKQQQVPSGHDPSAYVVRRLFAATADNEQVPITVLHRKGLVLDGTTPLFLEGYGGYGDIFATAFESTIFSLVDRGFVYAIAHVRGGLEKGARWHKGGSRLNKVNVFTDFIAVAEHLIKAGYSTPGRIVARGDSHGGLLMGAVANMRPDLFAGMIARVPCVDLLNTSLDDTLPLTTGDFPEFGNPIEDIAVYRFIASYAPYENVKAQPYPHMLVTGGISDSRVQYWEPAKWVAKLRAMKTNDARIILVMRISAGHFGAAGRFEWLDEVALMQAFALDVSGMLRPEDATPPGVAPPTGVVGPPAAPMRPAAGPTTRTGGGSKR